MDWNSAGPLPLMKERLSWLSERQRILAENIANSDTPGYVPREMKPLRPEDIQRPSSEFAIALSQTASGHLPGRQSPSNDDRSIQSRNVYESSPDGNGVVLEEQLAKLNETTASHRLTAALYKKFQGMIRSAAGARG